MAAGSRLLPPPLPPIRSSALPCPGRPWGELREMGRTRTRGRPSLSSPRGPPRLSFAAGQTLIMAASPCSVSSAHQAASPYGRTPRPVRGSSSESENRSLFMHAVCSMLSPCPRARPPSPSRRPSPSTAPSIPQGFLRHQFSPRGYGSPMDTAGLQRGMAALLSGRGQIDHVGVQTRPCPRDARN
jgi:hypothetical protein